MGAPRCGCRAEPTAFRAFISPAPQLPIRYAGAKGYRCKKKIFDGVVVSGAGIAHVLWSALPRRRDEAQKSFFDEAATLMSEPSRQVPLLTVIKPAEGTADRQNGTSPGSRLVSPAARDLEWSILMARAQEGDGDAYRRLLEEVTPYLRSLAARRHRDESDVEDAVQDILLTLHAIRQTYDPTRPFAPWLVTVANRRLVDRLRRQGRIRSQESALVVEIETFSTGQANTEEEISDRRELEAMLDTLPPGQRRALRLLKLEGLTLKEASAKTGISISALKVATHRALKALQKNFGSGSEDR